MRRPLRERAERMEQGKIIVSSKVVKADGKVVYHPWPSCSPAVPLPAPKLSASRILHIHETILPHVSEQKIAWWLEKAPRDVAEAQKAAKKSASTIAPIERPAIAPAAPSAVVLDEMPTVASVEPSEVGIVEPPAVYLPEPAAAAPEHPTNSTCARCKNDDGRVVHLCRGQCRQLYHHACMTLGEEYKCSLQCQAAGPLQKGRGRRAPPL